MDHDTDAQQASGATGPARRHLRLVSSAAAQGPLAAPGVAPTHRLKLRAWTSLAKPEVRTSAWADLLERIWPGEELHMVHRLTRTDGRPSTCSMHVDTCLSLSARASQTPQIVAEALRSTLPGLAFESVPCDQVSDALPLRATLAPLFAPLATLAQVQGPSRDTWTPQTAKLPFPANLPTWLLTVPYEEPLAETLEIRIRLRAEQLDEEGRSHFARMLQRLRGGSLHVFHPGAVPSADSIDRRLDDALKDLLQNWLRRPMAGFTLDVQVCSHEELSPYVLRRIGGDIFGAMPFRHSLDEPESVGASPPAVLLRPAQGSGGLFAAIAHLAAFGLPQHMPTPDRLPEGPGSEVGHVGRDTSLLLPDVDRLSHTAVIGGSGTGKSTFMMRTLTEDIRRGFGVGLIDVHGDLFDAVLSSIPALRAQDVVVVDIEDDQFSVALNPMDGTLGNPLLQNFVANQTVDLIERMFETEHSTGPMMRNHVRHVLLLAMCHPKGGTLADAARVFEDTAFRNWLLSHATQHLVSYFKTFAATNGDQGYANWLPYLIARLNPFVQNPLLLRTLSRPSTLKLGELMDHGKIVLFRLSKSVLQDMECELLGTLLLLQFHIAATARANRPPEQRRPFHLFVDEFHTFANDSTPAMFREARKFGLGLTVATQSFSSLRRRRGGDVTNAVLANTATKVLFRLSPFDANMVDEYSEPTFSARDLSRIPNHQAVVCMTTGELAPFRLRAALPELPARTVSPEALRQSSGHRYGTPLAEMQAYLAQRHGVAVASKASSETPAG